MRNLYLINNQCIPCDDTVLKNIAKTAAKHKKRFNVGLYVYRYPIEAFHFLIEFSEAADYEIDPTKRQSSTGSCLHTDLNLQIHTCNIDDYLKAMGLALDFIISDIDLTKEENGKDLLLKIRRPFLLDDTHQGKDGKHVRREIN